MLADRSRRGVALLFTRSWAIRGQLCGRVLENSGLRVTICSSYKRPSRSRMSSSNFLLGTKPEATLPVDSRDHRHAHGIRAPGVVPFVRPRQPRVSSGMLREQLQQSHGRIFRPRSDIGR